jgi:hypothetical protein
MQVSATRRELQGAGACVSLGKPPRETSTPTSFDSTPRHQRAAWSVPPRLLRARSSGCGKSRTGECWHPTSNAPYSAIAAQIWAWLARWGEAGCRRMSCRRPQAECPRRGPSRSGPCSPPRPRRSQASVAHRVSLLLTIVGPSPTASLPSGCAYRRRRTPPRAARSAASCRR